MSTAHLTPSSAMRREVVSRETITFISVRPLALTHQLTKTEPSASATPPLWVPAILPASPRTCRLLTTSTFFKLVWTLQPASLASLLAPTAAAHLRIKHLNIVAQAPDTKPCS